MGKEQTTERAYWQGKLDAYTEVLDTDLKVFDIYDDNIVNKEKRFSELNETELRNYGYFKIARLSSLMDCERHAEQYQLAYRKLNDGSRDEIIDKKIAERQQLEITCFTDKQNDTHGK